MKRILGLDLGTNSIGWALVEEAEAENEKSSIIKLGVRVNPLTVDEKTDFSKGKPLSTNADRTLKRSARRNLQRFKLRRQNLIQILSQNNWITKDSPLTETGSNTTHETLRIRAKAAREKISLDQLARVLLSINKKRGYKSSRKTASEDIGIAIDGMSIAKTLYDQNITPGQLVLQLLTSGKKYIPDFYRSDLQSEFDKIWNVQKQFYNEILTQDLYNDLQGKNKSATWSTCKQPFQIVGVKLEGNRDKQKLKKFELRTKALTDKLDLEHLAIVLQEINNQIFQSSGYLGKISDRSKELYFDKITVGEYLYRQIESNPHNSLKNQVFYRQDYLDEFEQIWETQSAYHPTLTQELKEEIRDIIIFYQRKLKSQKALLSFCQFENWQIVQMDDKGKPIVNKKTGAPKITTVGQKVIPKSSPLFQEFKIWQNINNLQIREIEKSIIDSISKKVKNTFEIDDEDRIKLFQELNVRGNLKEKEVLKILGLSSKEWKTNFPKGLEGNKTNKALFNVFQIIAENEGYGFDWNKKSTSQIIEELNLIFTHIGINPRILNFDANIEGNAFDKQKSYQLWHLLYSAEDDNIVSEKDKILFGNTNVNLKKNLTTKFGFKPEYSSLLANISLQDGYGNLSARAIKKVIPFLQDGHEYSDACSLAGYNHSNSLTIEEIENRVLKDRLEILPKNSLRNPVVEKILNQMVNLVNQLIDEYGKPDEVRIELARELKKSAEERANTTSFINKATAHNEDLRKVIQKEFGFYPTKNDLVRYKLYEELKSNGYKTIFSDRYIEKDKIFSKEIDIEHIIPKALLFDDSFSNKTLAFKDVNLKKDKRLAFDFIEEDYSKDLETYVSRVESLYKVGSISKGKYKKLLMTRENLPNDFIERDLRNSQYIAKKAKSILEEVFGKVVTTSGRITDKLRSDWELINMMKELNFPKFKALGLTTTQERYDIGKNQTTIVEIIKDWSKRNDHRHHAMDALTVAFTTHNHIQYINNLNAADNNQNSIFYSIRNKITAKYKSRSGSLKRRFIPPMDNFRSLAKDKVEDILISFKTKNKVVTKNINKIKTKSGIIHTTQLTPRGQLHKETVYSKSKYPKKKPTSLNSRFSIDDAKMIVNSNIKKKVIDHLLKYDNNSKIAFSSNTFKKDPISFHGKTIKKVHCFKNIYTIRKPIDPNINIEKVLDEGIKKILKERLNEFNGNKKEAFSNLDEHPIYLNKEKGICIKRVTIKGINNAEPLRVKKDHFGNTLLDENGNEQPVDFVSTGNNHHVAIYQDSEGKLHENVVSFYEAVARVNENLPIIDRQLNADKGWVFLFTMKQNEMFIFPSGDFDPNHIDLFEEKNAKVISNHLFRVQKISTKNYLFAHHLETQAITGDDLKNKKQLAGIAFYFIQTPTKLAGVIKVRINHIGKIVHVGEESEVDNRNMKHDILSEPSSKYSLTVFKDYSEQSNIESLDRAKMTMSERLTSAIQLIKCVYPNWKDTKSCHLKILKL